MRNITWQKKGRNIVATIQGAVVEISCPQEGKFLVSCNGHACLSSNNLESCKDYVEMSFFPAARAKQVPKRKKAEASQPVKKRADPGRECQSCGELATLETCEWCGEHRDV